MMNTTYKFGKHPLPLKYTFEELRSVIQDYIESKESFSYLQICNYILEKADEEGKLQKSPNTSYSEIVLTTQDARQISKILWGEIWDMNIFIDFYDNPYANTMSRDTVFAKY